ncbi:hypothetical protein [Nocardioides kongjuensis]|uniref:hypothetical protein n=1 Tax=Nocardioides kongjuensis TaxID=349522 RepID=UPI0031E93EB3
MSFGSLSSNAITAINKGAGAAGACTTRARARSRRTTATGPTSSCRSVRRYFGCRDEKGDFSLPRLLELIDSAPVMALEIKLSQGAKRVWAGCCRQRR